jgi:hypothetical protein
VDFYQDKQTPLTQAVANLLTLAFFFLLCPGEYTMPSSRTKSRTVQFPRLDNVGKDIIKKLGRWLSSTWLTYIHIQISSLTAGLSEHMAIHHVFYNVGS